MSNKNEETQIIESIFNSRVLFNCLDFILYPTFTNNPERPTRFKYSIALDSSELGFSNWKPGDIDILIVPIAREQHLMDYASACEVKIVKPTFKNLGRDANNSGIEQTKGLVKMGFPYVGLLHVITPEKASSEPNFIDILGSRAQQERQLGRQNQYDLNKAVGLSSATYYEYHNAFGVSVNNGEFCKRLTNHPTTELYAQLENSLATQPELWQSYEVWPDHNSR